MKTLENGGKREELEILLADSKRKTSIHYQVQLKRIINQISISSRMQ